MTVAETLKILKEMGDPEVTARKARDFGIPSENALGLYMVDINRMAKGIGRNSKLALELIDTEIYEARILASKIFHKKDLNRSLMTQWITFFNTWEICDSYCMQLFKHHNDSWDLMKEWVNHKSTFEKRAGFVVMATYGQGHKETSNEKYDECYPIIMEHATDERNFVKKAVNWAVREIGKRNVDLRHKCIELSESLLLLDNPTATWIAKDALKELSNPGVKMRNVPRSIYGLNA